jgi:hypothetical protein
MRYLTHSRSPLGFPLWVPLLLGVLLFLAGHLLAGERHHPHPHPISRNLIKV